MPNTRSMLEKRRVEAEMVRDFYEVLCARMPKPEAQDIVREAVAGSAIKQGAEYRAAVGHEPDLADFAEHSGAWDADNALDREILHAAPDRLEYIITRCEYA